MKKNPSDMECTQKTLLAAGAVFGGLTFMLPSFLTLWMYLNKWIPAESDPQKQQEMVLVLVGSGILGVGVVGAGLWYLHDSKCI